MQATGINPILVVVRKAFPDDKQLYDAYYKRYAEVRKLMDESKPPPQQLTEREASINWKTLDQINEQRVELQRLVNRKILHKKSKELTIEDKITLIRHLILCLFTSQPAVRNDYSEFPIIRFEDIGTAEARELMSGSGNYMLEFARDQFRLVLKDFRSVKHHGPTNIDMSTRSNNVIAESLQVFPRKFLLSRMRAPDKPMSRNYLTKFCSIGLFKDAAVGSCLLRKICVSNAMKDAPSLREQDELAQQMLHTASVAQRVYEKKYLPDGSKIRFRTIHNLVAASFRTLQCPKGATALWHHLTFLKTPFDDHRAAMHYTESSLESLHRRGASESSAEMLVHFCNAQRPGSTRSYPYVYSSIFFCKSYEHPDASRRIA